MKCRRALCSFLAVALCTFSGKASAASLDDDSCGVEVEVAPGAPDERYKTHFNYGSRVRVTDVEDVLLELSGADEESDASRMYRALSKECGAGSPQATNSSCRYFGVTPDRWNLTASATSIAMFESPRADCKKALKDANLGNVHIGAGVACQRIAGTVQIVAIKHAFISRSSLQFFRELPHLSAVRVSWSSEEDFSGLAFPNTVRAVDFNYLSAGQSAKLLSLIGASKSIRGVTVRGWDRSDGVADIDLSTLCGLDLEYFRGDSVNVGHIPDCWSTMTSLQNFYCTSCMMTSPPKALAGLRSLKSFVAFGQSEFSPCLLKKLSKNMSRCRVTWETKNLFLSESESPMFSCAEFSYAFPFAEFVRLGWSSLEKLWLDGNFLTGAIPENLPDVWPSLQSLDLYDNMMEGTIPESLARLDLVKLQLQGNNFSGILPPSLATKLTLETHAWNVAANPELQGCLATHGVAGTKITKCHEDL